MLGVLVGCSVPAVAQKAPSLDGSWNGTLQVPTNPTQLIISIREPAQASRTASLSVPKQKVNGLAFSGVEMQGDSLILRSDFLGVRYAARLSADGRQLSGTWKQNADKWPLTLDRGLPAAAPPPKRPQDPVAPLPTANRKSASRTPAPPKRWPARSRSRPAKSTLR